MYGCFDDKEGKMFNFRLISSFFERYPSSGRFVVVSTFQQLNVTYFVLHSRIFTRNFGNVYY